MELGRKLLAFIFILFLVLVNLNIGSTSNPIPVESKRSRGTIIVNASGGGDYTHISWAIANASDGDTIYVEAGTYYEQFLISKAISLIGAGRENTTIDPGDTDFAMSISTNWVNVSDFNIRGSLGIDIENTNYCKIENNHFSNYSILMTNCRYTIIKNNIMTNGGIYIRGDRLEYWDTHTIENTNTVNGKPVYYWKNYVGDIVPSGTGQVILVNCTSTTIQNLDLSNCTTGITLAFSSQSRIKNNTCWNNRFDGIRLLYSNYNIVINNTCTYNEIGIDLDESTNNTISYSNCSFNGAAGIQLFQNSDDNTIQNNTCIGNRVSGITTYDSPITIINNTCSYNGDHGIRMSNYLGSIEKTSILNNTCNENNGIGILVTVSNSIIANNSCNLNTREGIFLLTTGSSAFNNICNLNNGSGIRVHYKNNHIFKNTCISNKQYGIYISPNAEDNHIYENVLENNGIDNIYPASPVDKKGNFYLSTIAVVILMLLVLVYPKVRKRWMGR